MTWSTYKLPGIAILLLLTVGNNVRGQGCSDAGICTMSSFKPNHTDSAVVLQHQVKIGTFYGKADHAITVYGSYLEFSRSWGARLHVDAKLTTLAQSGNGIKVFGLSDLFVNASYHAQRKVSFTVGAKVPLSGANNYRNNQPLPMDYQASLGTVDLIGGIGFEIRKVQLVMAVQQPITQNNNQFLAAGYPLTDKLSGFQSTNKFRRSADVLLRVSYPVAVNARLKVTPGILPIYHLTNDRYTDASNTEQAINGSQGLTLNGTVYLDYQFSQTSVLQINFGTPFIARKARPDGLTRSFIANLEYSVRF